MSRISKSFFMIIAFILLISFPVSNLADASVYMPNNNRDVYTYKDNYGSEKIAETDSPPMFSWRHWTEFAGFGPVWILTFKWNEYVYLYANDRFQLFANFNAPVGSTWFIDAGECNRKVNTMLAARDEKVVVPAGTFDGCIRIDIQISCADAGTESVWFAPNVGVVKWISQSIAGPRPWEFIKGIVGGVVYPKPVPIALPLEGGTDRFEYFINMMPVIDPSRKPVLLQGKLSITNKSGNPIEFTFGACEFDIYIYDNEGRMVSHMNRGNDTCLQEIAINKTLKNDETWHYKGEAELADDEGNDLPEGVYKVECVIEANPAFSTSHTIMITHTH